MTARAPVRTSESRVFGSQFGPEERRWLCVTIRSGRFAAVGDAPATRAPGARVIAMRIRLKGFIERVPHTNTYRVTAHGRRMATFFTKLASRVVVPGLSELYTTWKQVLGTPGHSQGIFSKVVMIPTPAGEMMGFTSGDPTRCDTFRTNDLG